MFWSSEAPFPAPPAPAAPAARRTPRCPIWAPPSPRSHDPPRAGGSGLRVAYGAAAAGLSTGGARICSDQLAFPAGRLAKVTLTCLVCPLRTIVSVTV